jgi:hypothetical protein
MFKAARGRDSAPHMTTAAASGRIRRLTTEEIAWIGLIPGAAALFAAWSVLGPPLGRLLFPLASDPLWPPGWWETTGHHEPVKHGQYLLAMLAPAVLAGVVQTFRRRSPRLPPVAVRALVLVAQGSLVAVAVAAVLRQRDVLTGGLELERPIGARALAIASALVALALVTLRRPGVVAWIADRARERPPLRIAALAIAGSVTAAWLVEVVTTDGLAEDAGFMNWIPNGAYAVLDGRTPLVDVHLIYSKLLPYPTALVMSIFGASTAVFTAFMAILCFGALMAVYAVLRRIAGSAFALVLFVPFLALSDAGHWMTLGSIWPMRYGGAYLLAWLTARHVDGCAPRRPWILFLVAGLVTIDDLDFGLAATLACVAALLCAQQGRAARDLWRLVGAVAVGLLAALAAVAAFTFARTGDLPRAELLFEWSRIFTGLGWFSLPMPGTGLHLAIYATLAAAVVVAAVRFARRATDVLLTSMLAWSGVFGLVAGTYYVARPDDVKLLAMFSAWGLALVLLTIACARALTARRWRSPTPAEVLVLFGFGVAICMIGRFPSPVDRLSSMRRAPEPLYRATVEPFVERYAKRGARVAILLPESYRIAYDTGLTNVAPYEMANAIVTRRQLQTTIDVIEHEDVRVVFAPRAGMRVTGDAEIAPQHLEALVTAGFAPVASQEVIVAWRKGR